MTTHPFCLDKVDESWKPIIERALSQIDATYIEQLTTSIDWLPGPDKIFNAFSLPANQVHYVLFGESPYPRKQSANGYAFWDDAITQLWSDTGLSKQVNRATSMRNILKMLLVTEGLLDSNNTTQADIANLDKSQLVQTNQHLFNNLLTSGFLLLNATPVLQAGSPQKDAKIWKPFIQSILLELIKNKPDITLLLFGNIAQEIEQIISDQEIRLLRAEHPYNISFINNLNIQSMFRPLHLLRSK